MTLIPGDGIGPEVSEAAVRVVEATGVAIDGMGLLHYGELEKGTG